MGKVLVRAVGRGELSFRCLVTKACLGKERRWRALQDQESSSTKRGTQSPAVAQDLPSTVSEGKRLTPVAKGFQRNSYTKKAGGIPFSSTYYQN